MRSDIDAAIAALADGQWGVWTAQQAERLGATKSFRSRRVLKGTWSSPYPNVYTHRSWVRTPEGDALAAAWSLRTGVASIDTAAMLHRVDGATVGPVQVTVLRGHYQPRPFVVHETRYLPPSHVRMVRQVPCMSLSRTLIEVGRTWDPERLEAAWDAAITARRTSLSALQATALPLLGRGQEGSDLVRAMLLARDDEEPPPESVLERVMLDIVEAGGYGPAIRQMPLPSFTGLRQRADAYLPHVGVFLEADGRRWHTRLRDFERDRRRDNEAQALGHHVARFTYRELTEHRGRVIEVLDQHFRTKGFARSASGLWVPSAAA